jgi:hypothetical protein
VPCRNLRGRYINARGGGKVAAVTAVSTGR